MASAVEICNIALTRLGADSIRSFDENNKRARTSQIIYEHVRDLFLEDHEWTFNTKYAALAELSTVTHPTWTYIYAIPSDCLYPRALIDSLGKIDSRVNWEVWQGYIGCDLSSPTLKYSSTLSSTASYPKYFIEAMASQIAAELAPAIVQDKQRFDSLTQFAEVRFSRAREKDAEMAVEYPHFDVNADNDRFVYPSGQELVDEEDLPRV